MLVEVYGMGLEELFNIGIGYLIANAGVIVAFIIYMIRLKLKEIKASEIFNAALEKANVKMNDETLKKIDEIQKSFELELANMQKALLLQVSENEEERNRIIEEKTLGLKEALDSFKASNENIDEEINNILNE